MNGKVWVVGEQRGGNQRSLSLLITPWTAVSADRSYSSTLGKVELENRRILVREAGAAKMGTLVRMHLCSFWFRCQLNRWSGQTMWGTQKDVILLKKLKWKINKQTKMVSKEEVARGCTGYWCGHLFFPVYEKEHTNSALLGCLLFSSMELALLSHTTQLVQCSVSNTDWHGMLYRS